MMLTISAEVKPTEDPEKVAEAVRKIFPAAELEIKKDSVGGRAYFKKFKVKGYST